MKRGGAGTVLLVIFFLLIIVVLVFPNQVEQFLSQFNISLGNGTVNSSQLLQQFTNGLQNYLNNGNSYQNYSTVVIGFSFNGVNGVSRESTYNALIESFNGISTFQSPIIVPTDNNIIVYENGNNINFQFGLKYSGGCNNTINSIYIHDPELGIGIASYGSNGIENAFYNITIQDNQYGFYCEPIGVVQLNPTVTVSCSINLNQLESDPQIQSIMNQINSAGESSGWWATVVINVSYNCQ
jgi:hypothetical protein